MPKKHQLHPLQASFESRFWKYVQKTDTCWLWTGFLDEDGRGRLRPGRASEGTSIGASRASWIVHFGNIPDGKFVLHHCDNARCVRPDHLYIGTQQDNMRDRKVRKRHHLLGRGYLLAGDKNPHARLTWDIVAEIRKAHGLDASGPSLSKKYGVTKENIYHIVNNRTWVISPLKCRLS